MTIDYDNIDLKSITLDRVVKAFAEAPDGFMDITLKFPLFGMQAEHDVETLMHTLAGAVLHHEAHPDFFDHVDEMVEVIDFLEQDFAQEKGITLGEVLRRALKSSTKPLGK